MSKNTIEKTPRVSIPEKFLPYIGGYGAVLFDSHCGEPIKWGYPLVQRLGETLWEELSKWCSANGAELDCNYGGGGQWFLVDRKLLREEAIAIYGEVTNIERGPRGGFRSITFGKKTFLQRELST